MISFDHQQIMQGFFYERKMTFDLNQKSAMNNEIRETKAKILPDESA